MQPGAAGAVRWRPRETRGRQMFQVDVSGSRVCFCDVLYIVISSEGFAVVINSFSRSMTLTIRLCFLQTNGIGWQNRLAKSFCFLFGYNIQERIGKHSDSLLFYFSRLKNV